jgi:capsular exopolysaccharide synthesis family protein
MELLFFLEILQRRKKLFIGAFLSIFLLFVLLCHLLPNVYESRSKLLISSRDVMTQLLAGIDVIAPDMWSDSSDNSEKQQVLSVLMPQLEEMVERLELRNIWGKPMEPEKLTGLKLPFLPNPHILVQECGDSVDVIEILASSRDRDEAARMSNTLAQLFIDSETNMLRQDFDRLENAIQRSMEQARQEYADLQQRIRTHRVEVGAVDLDEETNLLMQRILDIETEVDTNEQLFAQSGATVEVTRELMGTIDKLRDESFTLANSEQLTELKLKLNDYLLTLAGEKVELTQKHPTIQAVTKQVEQAKALIEKEKSLDVISVNRTVAPLYDSLNEAMHDAMITLAHAQAQRTVLGQLLELQRARIAPLAGMYQERAGLNLDISSSENRFDVLRNRALNLDIFRTLALSNIKVVEQAKPARRRSFPKKKIFYPAGLFLGVLFALGAVLLPEYMDDKIHREDQVRAIMPGPFLTVVPASQHLAEGRSVGELQAGSLVTEALRNVKTRLLLDNGNAPPAGAVLITSSVDGEGRSTLTANLGALFARAGFRTLVADLDVRIQGLGKLFKGEGHQGLAEVLRGEADLASVVAPTSQDNLYFLPAGAGIADPSWLAGSDALEQVLQQAETAYDMVLLDGPPLLLYADAGILLDRVGTNLYVVEAGRASCTMLKDARDLMQRLGVEVGGLVMNKYINHVPNHYNARFNKPIPA